MEQPEHVGRRMVAMGCATVIMLGALLLFVVVVLVLHAPLDHEPGRDRPAEPWEQATQRWFAGWCLAILLPGDVAFRTFGGWWPIHGRCVRTNAIALVIALACLTGCVLSGIHTDAVRHAEQPGLPSDVDRVSGPCLVLALTLAVALPPWLTCWRARSPLSD